MMDLLDDPESVRAHYYLGNSLVGIGMNVQCLDTYHKGQNLLGWVEERYNATIESHNAMNNLKEPLSRQLVNFLYSSHINPQRLELRKCLLPSTYVMATHETILSVQQQSFYAI